MALQSSTSTYVMNIAILFLGCFSFKGVTVNVCHFGDLESLMSVQPIHHLSHFFHN